MDVAKPQLHAKFEVAGFICYENIRESVFKRQIRFLSHPLGELGAVFILVPSVLGESESVEGEAVWVGSERVESEEHRRHENRCAFVVGVSEGVSPPQLTKGVWVAS